ncbi:hypothetical protein VSS86_22970, partial [Bacillus safensis]
SEKQLAKVRKGIAKLERNITHWKPPYQLAAENSPTADIADFDDYCSSLWNGTHARFFKFKSGRFKTYFVMSTNCVFLA